jgi:pectate lyase
MKAITFILIFSLLLNTITPKFAKFDSPFLSFAENPNNLRADGFASQNGGTTGGKGGQTVTVSNYKDFKAAVQSNDAKIVIVQGTIKTTDGDGYGLRIKGNKTIMGKDKKATIYGGLSISGVKNVIIYNINIQGSYPNPGPGDCLDISGGSTNVWIHHVAIWDADDGNIDIKGKASYITVSYCKFYYTNSKNSHRFNGLIGSGAANHPEDFGYLKVTYHHCWFGNLLYERMPRVVYGQAHIYNNYYTASGDLYCIGVGSYASALIESNYFKKVTNPIQFIYNIYTYILQKNNVFEGCSGTKDGTKDGKIYGQRYITTAPYTLKKDPVKLNSVPYSYKVDNAKDIPNIVQSKAGPQ